MAPTDRSEWSALLVPLGASPASPDARDRTYHDVVARYGEPGRHYHRLGHIDEVLGTVDRLAHRLRTPLAVRLAAWLHDVVYDTRAAHDGGASNEAASAAYAQAVLPRLGVPPPVVAETSRLILMTATHVIHDGDVDGAVLADADLAILGSSPARYRRYVADVRAEWAWLPEDRWRAGRLDVLRRFAERPRLFSTPELHAELDGVARVNLESEMAGLP